MQRYKKISLFGKGNRIKNITFAHINKTMIMRKTILMTTLILSLWAGKAEARDYNIVA